MKKKLFAIVLVFAVVLSCTFLSSPIKTPVAAAGEEESLQVLKARFLNMLNHNFVYGSSFYDTEALVNDSMPALLELRDTVDEDYIDEAYVKDYVFNMYGIELGNLQNINTDFPQKDGFVFIVPRGFSVYSHQILKIVENEDNSFSVTTQVYVDDHDKKQEPFLCETLFAENKESSFGYSIVYSKLIEGNSKM
ncbi:MAG: hypothetical protein IJZ75_06595 [Clostridia bacterium]|nr:hypothetical protein [Clostridia bacterium]